MTNENNERRCLIVERHDWETGGGEQQLQLPLEVARQFFGEGDASREITIRMFLPPRSADPAYEKQISVSEEYPNSTRRLNGFDEVGAMPSCFIFFEETESPGVYDVWWVEDKAIVAARYNEWQQARLSQYGRGRLAIIVPAPVSRNFSQI